MTTEVNGEVRALRSMGVAGGAGSNSGSDLASGAGALKRFQTRVNALLTEFEAGPAGPAELSAHPVRRTSLSGPNAAFAEADALCAQFNRVQQLLVSLARTLGDQIECLSIGVHAAEVGFDQVEEDVRRRYAAIHSGMERDHAARRERENSTRSGQRDDTRSRCGG
jgi:hypothetical protein